MKNKNELKILFSQFFPFQMILNVFPRILIFNLIDLHLHHLPFCRKYKKKRKMSKRQKDNRHRKTTQKTPELTQKVIIIIIMIKISISK